MRKTGLFYGRQIMADETSGGRFGHKFKRGRRQYARVFQ